MTSMLRGRDDACMRELRFAFTVNYSTDCVFIFFAYKNAILGEGNLKQYKNIIDLFEMKTL